MLRANVLPALLVVLLAGCSSEGRQSARDTSTSSAVSMPSARCESVEREDGPCILWGPSLIELIARPELYDGKRVRVIGFVNFEFEGNGLYVAREDWRQSIARNGLWIDPPKGFESDSAPSGRQPNQRYVIVEATFHGGPGGHFGMWSGSLDSVTRLEPWGVGENEARSAPHQIP